MDKQMTQRFVIGEQVRHPKLEMIHVGIYLSLATLSKNHAETKNKLATWISLLPTVL